MRAGDESAEVLVTGFVFDENDGLGERFGLFRSVERQRKLDRYDVFLLDFLGSNVRSYRAVKPSTIGDGERVETERVRGFDHLFGP